MYYFKKAEKKAPFYKTLLKISCTERISIHIDLVGFYAISNIVDYLMLNPLYTCNI